MARSQALTRNKWKAFFRDRSGLRLWLANNEVAKNCKLRDGRYRYLKVELEPKYQFSMTDWFRITSGKEVSFRKELQDRIADIVARDKDSFLTIEVLSNEEKNARPQ